MTGNGDQHTLWALLAGAFYVLGVLSAANALLYKRNTRSAIAWAVSCITLPYVAVPLYWLFGKRRFEGYVLARRSSNAQVRKLAKSLRSHSPDLTGLSDDIRQMWRVFEKLAAMPFTRGNRVELLIDGEASFDAIFRKIDTAREYILIQFFIVRADNLGERIRETLARKAREGVRVYFLYDQIGSYSLPGRYVRSLQQAGIQVRAFKTTRGFPNRFQINFRNHRKMVLVDGDWVATGGVNIGDEYLGKSERFGYWRDTMIAVSGPAVQELQVSFSEDWYFLSGEVPEMSWELKAADSSDQSVLVLPMGPADELSTCSMVFTQAIHTAEERLWLTSPYFVPDGEIVRALQLAALRGVDVRILLPEKADHRLVHWASFTYLEELERTGVRFRRYQKGLLHEKVMLVDNAFAMVGSANLDNRSFYLNFELSLLVADSKFTEEVERMLERDLADSRESGSAEFREKGFFFLLLARASRLFSPVL
ncbi:MAG: cardiolipin synthase [Gemmatimonadota bacterium]